MKKIFLLLAMVLAVQRLPAQVPGDSRFVPLYVSINGSGRIYPNYDGEMLLVGRAYTMEAIPDRGYKFASWQPVDIITLTFHALDQNGHPTNITSTAVSAEDQYVINPVLIFRMQRAETVSAGADTITASHGWQANFVPRPPRQDIINNPIEFR